MKKPPTLILMVTVLIAAITLGLVSACQGAKAENEETITILHTNDFHGSLEAEVAQQAAAPVEHGGAANLVGTIDKLRKESGGKVLVLDAGDVYQGTYVSNQNKGAAVIELWNIAGYDALTLGNHDFDFGLDALRERATQARFPFLAANVVEESTGKVLPLAKPYVITTVGSIRVGVIGISYPGTPAITRPSNVTGLKFLPADETLSQYVPEVRKEADVIVVLSHAGIDQDEKLAATVKGIDVIVGGHTHTELRNARTIGSTVIVQAGSKGKLLGKLDLTVDTKTKRIVKHTTQGELMDVVSTKATASSEAASIVDRYLQQAQVAIKKPIGQALEDLNQQYAGEFPLGNLVVDAMRSVNAGGGKLADIAIHNNGGIRANIPKGPVSYGQVYEAVPFDNVLIAIDLKGEQIWRILEQSVSGRPGNLQISGGKMIFDYSKPQGSRLLSVEIGGQPLDRAKTYRVQTIDYLASGGDGQDEFKKGTNPQYGPPVVDVVVEYIQKNSPVAPRLEGRITTKSGG